MAITSKIHIAAFIIFIYAGITIMFGNKMVNGQCVGDFEGLIQQCSRYVQKGGPNTAPSNGCCEVVKAVDMACVCKHITAQVEQIISMEKAAYVAGFCGKPLAHGTKCGSYTVP